MDVELFLENTKRRFIKWLLPWKIPAEVWLEEDVLDDIRQLARDAYPKEFVAFLNGEVLEREGKNVALVDGLSVIAYNASHISTSFNLYDIPTVHGMVGTIHSHPSSSTRWSRADLRLFGKFAWVHGIIGRPYAEENLVFYDKNGNAFPWKPLKNSPRSQKHV
jgi:proteasome lid subunit RPN8/RPN11